MEPDILATEVAAKWKKIALEGSAQIDKRAARRGLIFSYSLKGWKLPDVIFAESPLECQEVCNSRRLSRDFKQSINCSQQIRGHIYWSFQRNRRVNKSGMTTGMRYDVKRSVLQAVTLDIACRIRVALSMTLKQERLSNFAFSSDGLGYAAGFAACYDFVSELMGVRCEFLERYNRFLKSGVFYSVLHRDCAIVCGRPAPIVRDHRGRPHSTVGMAVQWPDGYGAWFIDGVLFSEPLWRKAVSRQLTPLELVKISNLERKEVAMRLYGMEKLVTDIGARIVGEEIVSASGSIKRYEVLEIDLKDDDLPARFVKVACWSTGREYLIRVDPRDDSTRTPIGALAWTARMKGSEYVLDRET